MDETNNIEIIKNQLSGLDDANFDLNSWLLVTDNFLKSIWGHDTSKSQQLFSICNNFKTQMLGVSDDDIPKFKSQWKILLQGYIVELEKIGKTETKIKHPLNNINLTVSQTQTQEQSQTQTIEIEKIINAIKNELTGRQIKELDLIIKEPDTPKKSKKITDKLMSFGTNVAAGILSNILSNPKIMGLE